MAFRASPWINTYASTDAAPSEDVDMEAPLISTLKDDDTTPPPPSATPSAPATATSISSLSTPHAAPVGPPKKTVTKPRVRLVVKQPVPSSSQSRPQATSDEDDHEDDLEEDQLVDDVNAIDVPYSGAVSSLPRRKRSLQPWRWPSSDEETVKVTAPKKTTPAAKKKSKPTKAKVAPNPVPVLLDDGDNASESYAGTAPSSPAPSEQEYVLPPPSSLVSASTGPSQGIQAAVPDPAEDMPISLEGIPQPVYPLPTKPFPVMPPVKISTGLAQSIPLDKNKFRVRSWRVANREIRGVAGGRFFLRTWAGSKSSEYAAANQNPATNVSAVSGKGKDGTGGMSASAPPGTKSKVKAKGSAAASISATPASASVGPSRAGSSLPDSSPARSALGSKDRDAAQVLTKMRTIYVPPPDDEPEGAEQEAVSVADEDVDMEG